MRTEMTVRSEGMSVPTTFSMTQCRPISLTR